MGLASIATLVHAARASHISESEDELRDRLDSERSTSSDAALVLLATVQWHCAEFEASLLTIDQMDGIDAEDGTSNAAKAVNGWVLLSQAGIGAEARRFDRVTEDDEDDVHESATSIAEAQRSFEGALIEDPSSIDVRCISMLGGQQCSPCMCCLLVDPKTWCFCRVCWAWLE